MRHFGAVRRSWKECQLTDSGGQKDGECVGVGVRLLEYSKEKAVSGLKLLSRLPTAANVSLLEEQSPRRLRKSERESRKNTVGSETGDGQ